MEIYNVECKRCGASRNANLKEPCPLCGSREVPLLGYTYGIERSQIITALIVFAVMILVAVVAGALYILYKNFFLQTVLLPTGSYADQIIRFFS
ncbi:MAG: hypothetical protein QM730_14160 [Anaerolineales bacterium]